MEYYAMQMKEFKLADEDNFELAVTTTLMVEDVRALVNERGLEFEEMTVEEVWSLVEANLNTLPVADEVADFAVLN